MAKLKSGKYTFNHGKINKISFDENLFEFLLIIAFSLSFTLELLLFYTYFLESRSLYYKPFLFAFNVLFLITIYLIVFIIFVSIFSSKMFKIKKDDRSSIKLLLLALIFFNCCFVTTIIKDFNNISFGLLDSLLFLTLFTSGVFIIGIIIAKIIFEKIKSADINPSTKTFFILKISSASLGIVLICSIILLLDASIIALSGNISFKGQTVADIWEWENFAFSMAIIGAGIGISLVIVWKRREIFGSF